MPIVKVGQAMNELTPGQTLSVEADDPVFGPDLAAWVEITGNELVEYHDGPPQRALLRKRVK
jgi:TusA-related sulfurtransferase